MEIKLIIEASKGAAISKKNGTKAGEMTFSVASEKMIIIDHTEVDPAFKGKSIGKKMLYKIVEMARKKNIEVLPLCPFVKAMFQKLEDIQDVLKK